MPDIACLNGTFLPLSEARISVEDRGFMFGDGVYEVIRVYDGQPFLLDAHLVRLARSLAEVRIGLTQPLDTLREWIGETVRRAAYAEAKIYVHITRGVAPRDHVFPNVPPTLLITVTPIKPLAEAYVRNGVAVITTEDIRWGRCDIKSLNLLPNVLARQQAVESGAFEAVLIGRDGDVREGAGSNIFAVLGQTVVSPPLGPNILAGVTRARVFEVAGELGVAVTERILSRDDLFGATELFLSGTTIEIVGVVKVDGKTIGTGQPGPITRRLMAAFRPAKAAGG